MREIEELIQPHREFFEESLPRYFHSIQERLQTQGPFDQALTYALFQKGKRFRPALCLMSGEAMGLHPNHILPWAVAIEMIHTYSLVHDDLPCLDNDAERRGRPTTHIQYSEAAALLVGDVLLTEAFGLVAESYQDRPATALALVKKLAQYSGLGGMAGGQVLDCIPTENPMTEELLLKIHDLKTGALIRLCTEGVAEIAGLPTEKIELFADFGQDLGRAFQLSDDQLDFEQDVSNLNSVRLLGKQRVVQLIKECSDRATCSLISLGLGESQLRKMMILTCQRGM